MVYTIYSVRKCDKKGYIYNLFYYGIKVKYMGICYNTCIYPFPVKIISHRSDVLWTGNADVLAMDAQWK